MVGTKGYRLEDRPVRSSSLLLASSSNTVNRGLLSATLMAGVLLICWECFQKLGAVGKFIPIPSSCRFWQWPASASFLRSHRHFRADVRREEKGLGRLCGKMDDSISDISVPLIGGTRLQSIVQYLHRCHYTAVLEDSRSLIRRRSVVTVASLADSPWGIRLYRFHQRPFQHVPSCRMP